MAKLTFFGATDGVTGSCYLLETQHSILLLECGLIQGRRKEEKANKDPFPFNIQAVDAVVLSHAHLDHSGRLPKLVADGYQNPVYVTTSTRDLLEIMHKDSAFLAQRDAEWENKRRRRAGKEEIEPLYTMEDVESALGLCQGLQYGKREKITTDIELCYRDAGHILGSAIVELFITEDGKEKKLVFSGDLGNSSAALLRDPQVVTTADVLLLESTYGDRNHRPMEETLDEFEAIIESASKQGGNVLIPSFAVGRTQEILFRLGEMYQKGKLSQRTVYLDSPMAIATTDVYQRYQQAFNKEDLAVIKQDSSGNLKTFLPILEYTPSTEESMAINTIDEGVIIIAGSGMCNGGRIRHHFKHNLWRKDAHVIIVGFQARGTPGRSLVDGAKTFKMGGEKIAVNAKIHTLGGFSAHAGQSQLLDWVSHFTEPRPAINIIHGEQEAKNTLSEKLREQGWTVNIPKYGENLNF
jgi:metallo-beta-lactamase family protein